MNPIPSVKHTCTHTSEHTVITHTQPMALLKRMSVRTGGVATNYQSAKLGFVPVFVLEIRTTVEY